MPMPRLGLMQFEVRKLAADSRFGVTLHSDGMGGFPTVDKLVPGELFAKAGIRCGDRIVAVSTAGGGIWKAAGANYTSEKLREAPAYEAITIHVERDVAPRSEFHASSEATKAHQRRAQTLSKEHAHYHCAPTPSQEQIQKTEDERREVPIRISKPTQEASVGVILTSHDIRIASDRWSAVRIRSLVSSGLLASAGAIVGDELISIDGTTPEGATHATSLLKQAPAATVIHLLLRRGGDSDAGGDGDAAHGSDSPKEVLHSLSEVTIRL